MLSDRTVGVLCLSGAAIILTWGGPYTHHISEAGRIQEVAVLGDAPGRDRATAAEEEPTTTTAVAETTTTTVAPAATTTSTKPKPTTTTVSTVDAKAAAAAKAADELLAQKAVLGGSDMQSGFIVTKPAPAPNTPDVDSPFEKCLGPDSQRLTGAVRARRRSAEFAKSKVGSVSSSSAVFADPQSATDVVNVLGSPSSRSCFEQLINARLASNPNLPEDARGTLTPVDPGKVGDQAAAFRFQVMLPAEDVEDDPDADQQVPYIADFLFVRKDRVLLLFEFGSLRQPFPVDTARSMAGGVSGRL